MTIDPNKILKLSLSFVVFCIPFMVCVILSLFAGLHIFVPTLVGVLSFSIFMMILSGTVR